MAELGAIAAPPTQFESVQDIYEKTYEHETHRHQKDQ